MWYIPSLFCPSQCFAVMNNTAHQFASHPGLRSVPVCSRRPHLQRFGGSEGALVPKPRDLNMILRVMKNVGPIANSSTNKQFVNDTGLEKTYADLHVVVFCFISILYRLYIYIYIDLSTLQEAKPLSSCFHQPHRHSTTELLWLMAPNGRIQCHLPFSKSQCG